MVQDWCQCVTELKYVSKKGEQKYETYQQESTAYLFINKSAD